MDKFYEDVANIIQVIRRKYPSAGAAIAEVERELTVLFMEKDAKFSASLFLSACKLPDAEIAARAREA